MVIYVDVLIVTNFLISYFLLMASALLAEYTYSKKRIIFSAFTGALFCLYIFVDSGTVLLDFLIKSFSLVVCSAAAFGIKDRKKLILQMLCYFVLNMMLTGMVYLISFENAAVYQNNMFYYFSVNPVILVVSSAVIYIAILLFEIVKEKISPQKIYYMDIFFKEFSLIDVAAFFDSGLKLKDIVSNKDVVIVGYEKIKDFLPCELKNNIYHFFRGSYSNVVGGFIPVFFSTLSGNGMIPAVKSEYILVENKRIDNILVAFTEGDLGENVTALFGADIRKQF